MEILLNYIKIWTKVVGLQPRSPPPGSGPEKALIFWVMGSLEGMLTFHKFWPQGWARGENLGQPKKSVKLLFLLRLSLRH